MQRRTDTHARGSGASTILNRRQCTHMNHVSFHLITHVDHLLLSLFILSCCSMAWVVHSLFNHSLSMVVQAPFFIPPQKHFYIYPVTPELHILHQGSQTWDLLFCPNILAGTCIVCFFFNFANWMDEKYHLSLLQ